MKKTARVLAVLLALILCCASAQASGTQYEVFEENGFAYIVLEDQTACVIDFNLSGDIAIPSTLGGYPVASLMSELFEAKFNVTSVTIPASVRYFGLYADDNMWDYVFSYCYNLTAIHVAADNPVFCSVDGVLYSKDQSILYNYPCDKAGEEYRVPDKVHYIACTAFASSNHLKKLYLEGDNTTWFTYTFWSDSNLTVYYPNSGLAKQTAERFISNGLSADTDPIWNRYEAVGSSETGEEDPPQRLIGDNNGDGRVTEADGTTDPGEVYARMMAMKGEFYEGMRWTNDNAYVWHGSYYYGYGCVAFAFILSDAAFGGMPAREIPVDYDSLLPGDILRINNDSHSVIILEKYDDHVVIAEGNFNSSIHWGRTLSRSFVLGADFVMTRYPEKPAPQEDDPADAPGNVTGDENGTVDGRDVLRLARYLAGQDVTINYKAADVNGDGNVDGRDLLRLARYLAGENVELKKAPR